MPDLLERLTARLTRRETVHRRLNPPAPPPVHAVTVQVDSALPGPSLYAVYRCRCGATWEERYRAPRSRLTAETHRASVHVHHAQGHLLTGNTWTLRWQYGDGARSAWSGLTPGEALSRIRAALAVDPVTVYAVEPEGVPPHLGTVAAALHAIAWQASTADTAHPASAISTLRAIVDTATVALAAEAPASGGDDATP